MATNLVAPSTPATAAAGGLSPDRTRERVDAALAAFLAGKADSAPDPCLPPLVTLLGEFLEGGKRLRPLFCHCGWLAAGGAPEAGQPVLAGAALELFHAFALVHDDIMDGSDLRRGRPTVHRALAAGYRGPGGGQAAERFGTGTAILLGDLCLVWSDELLAAVEADDERRRAVRGLVDTMRTELIAGQYLDMAGASGSDDDQLRQAWQVVRLKTARYTVELPLRIGATLAGANTRVLNACAAYGRPVGEAFQLRDDLLGAFGDPAVTGKPDLDDLREGKRTVLMALAWRHATAAQRQIILALHGKPDLDREEADRLRAVVRDTGAVTRVEELIEDRAGRALSVLGTASIAAEVKPRLAELVVSATTRTR